jgi:hypothetical protein
MICPTLFSGPARYPILGNLPQMADAHQYGYRAFHKLSEKHGDIMSLKIGMQEMSKKKIFHFY